jgi:mRNA interferase MazF
MNRPLGTVIVAPMTSASRGYPSRVALRFQDKSGQVAADQIRAVDKDRLVKKMGRVPAPVLSAVLAVLVEMFSQRRG